MYQSIEEEELNAQREAAVSLLKDLQKKIRLQDQELETRTEAAEMVRIEVEIDMERLQQEEDGSVASMREKVQIVTRGWLAGVVLGWSGGYMLGMTFSPVLGFMLILPSVSAGIVGGLVYAQVRGRLKAIRRETVRRDHHDKKEFLRQLQGKPDPSLASPRNEVGDDTPSDSTLRRIFTDAADTATKSLTNVAVACALYVLGIGRPVRRGAGARAWG